MAAQANIIRLDEALRPEFTEKQEQFCADLIGMGLTHLTIISLVLGVDTEKLNHAQVASGHRLIADQKKQLGYGVMDARRAHSPFMAEAVKAASRNHRVRVRFA